MPVVLSISSQVVRGHVGNSAAVPALATLGHEVWPLPSVVFAFHPGHDRDAPRVVAPASMIADTIDSLAGRGWLADIGAVLTGYVASKEQLQVLAAAIDTVRDLRPDALVAVDPVIGDGGSVYIAPAVAAGLRERILPKCDLAMPNCFELGWLTGREVRTLDEAVAAARTLPGSECLVTSAPGSREDVIATLVVTEDGAWLAETAIIDHAAHGAGDLTSALYLGHRLNGEPPDQALAATVALANAVLVETAARSADELALTATLNRLTSEPAPVRVARIG